MTHLEKLQQVKANPARFNLRRGSQNFFDFCALVDYGRVYTYHNSYSCGYFNSKDTFSCIGEILTTLKTPFIVGNDAPRGGKAGDFIQLTGITYKRIRARLDAERKDREEREELIYNNTLQIIKKIECGELDADLKKRAPLEQIFNMKKQTKRNFFKRFATRYECLNSAGLRNAYIERLKQL